MKVNGENNFDLNAIDSKTKFVLAHTFTDERNRKNCIGFLSQIKNSCYNQILTKYYLKKYTGVDERIVFVCDGFENYKSAFNKLFYRVARLQFGVPIACKKYGLEYNNNAIERYNGKINDRLNATRGEFKSFETAESFMNLQHVTNNFVNPHQQLKGKTPAEIAGINFSLRRNKILDLILYAATLTR